MPENVQETGIEATPESRPVEKTSKETDGRIDRLVQETRQLTDDLTEWMNLRIRLIQLDIQERIDRELDFVFSGVIVLCMIMIALMMASVGIALVLGDLFGESWYGFAIMAVLYIVAAMVISRARPRLARGFRSSWTKDKGERASKPTEGDQ